MKKCLTFLAIEEMQIRTISRFNLISVMRASRKQRTCWVGCQWLMPVILAIQEAEIRRIVGSKPAWANSLRDLTLKALSQKKLGWCSGSR
jgi:hypothetical protein